MFTTSYTKHRAIMLDLSVYGGARGWAMVVLLSLSALSSMVSPDWQHPVATAPSMVLEGTMMVTQHPNEG